MTLLILLACVSVMAVVGVPAGWDRTYEAPPEPETVLNGTPLYCDVQSSRPCLLRIQPGENTQILGGRLATLDPEQKIEGTFRYWNESGHRSLYVYDDVQNLVARIVDPEHVLLVDLSE